LNFFSFGSSEKEKGNTTSEIETYLTDNSRELNSLHRFPVIEKAFLRYNAPLPTSAPVERLFSLGSHIYNRKRNRLTDGNFERQLLLRANKWLSKVA
jgi:hypothetical protein